MNLRQKSVNEFSASRKSIFFILNELYFIILYH